MYNDNLNSSINNIDHINSTYLENKNQLDDKYGEIYKKYDEVINAANLIKDDIENKDTDYSIKILNRQYNVLKKNSDEVNNLNDDDLIKDKANHSANIAKTAIKRAYIINYKLKTTLINRYILYVEKYLFDYNDNKNKKNKDYINFVKNVVDHVEGMLNSVNKAVSEKDILYDKINKPNLIGKQNSGEVKVFNNKSKLSLETIKDILFK